MYVYRYLEQLRALFLTRNIICCDTCLTTKNGWRLSLRNIKSSSLWRDSYLGIPMGVFDDTFLFPNTMS